MKLLKNYYLSVLLGIIFFTSGVLTLPHYGINWDTINHLPRGQAYLRYFLTGQQDYSGLPEWKQYYQNPSSLFPVSGGIRRSIYQSEAVPFSYFIEYDGDGHPPLSDILSAGFNYVLFQKLGLINDIDAYRVYGILLASILVFLVFKWGSKAYGTIAGLVAALSLALYPLFWSEAHFNTEKDIPETVYWSLLLFSVWKGITDRSWRWILASGVFLGLALGTKFNILFVVFVIFPWLALTVIFPYLRMCLKPKDLWKMNKQLLIAGICAPVLGLTIFIGTWPYLWADPIRRIGGVIGFYRTIGTTSNIDSRFLGPLNMNTYPLQWILETTPLVILFLALIGIIMAFLRFRKEKDKTSLLLLLWLTVPILRVSWTGATVYGGIRQIMEYIPALALLSGLGGQSLYEWILYRIKRSNIASLEAKKMFLAGIFLALFIPITFKLVQTHPNENVYFNSLGGGLYGAKEHNLPSWGNTFGAAYRQGIVWLNENAEKNARIAFARELLPNIPSIWIREDLILHNSFRSGFLRQGEYIIGLTYEGTDETAYFDRYLERFLIPVYEVKIDEVSILKIWKNDEEHIREELLYDQELQDFKFYIQGQDLLFDFKKRVQLSRLEANFTSDNCAPLRRGIVRISDNGSDWRKLPGKMPKEDWNVPAYGDQPEQDRLFIPFAADEARFLEISVSPDDSCLKKLNNIKVFIFP